MTAGSVAVVSYTDVAGNAGTGDRDTVTIDTRNPTVEVNIVDASLNDGDTQIEVTFTFSEAVSPASVVLDDVWAARCRPWSGTRTNTAATATFTATQDSVTAGSVAGGVLHRRGRQRRDRELGFRHGEHRESDGCNHHQQQHDFR